MLRTSTTRHGVPKGDGSHPNTLSLPLETPSKQKNWSNLAPAPAETNHPNAEPQTNDAGWFQTSETGLPRPGGYVSQKPRLVGR